MDRRGIARSGAPFSRAVYRRFEESVVNDAMAEGLDAVQSHWEHPDADEGPRAFGEKRPPVWQD